MAAKLLVNPIVYVTTSAGLVDSDATIDTYVSGASSVRQATYHDSTEQSPHSNPITYSQLATVSPLIYVPESNTYRMVITPSDGSAVKTIDNIVCIPSTRKPLTADLNVGASKVIVSGAGQDITIQPGIFGDLILNGAVFPLTDGLPNQILVTAANNRYTWAYNAPIVSADTSPQLGGDLDANGFNINLDTSTGIKDESGNWQVKFITGTNAVNYLDITNAATGNNPRIYAAGSDTNIDLNINNVYSLNSIKWVLVDGQEGSPLGTNGITQYTLLNRALYNTIHQRVYTACAPFYAHIFSGALTTIGTTTSFTPRYSTSTLRIEIKFFPDYNGGTYLPNTIFGLFQDNSTTPIACVSVNLAYPPKEPHTILAFVPSSSKTSRTYYLKSLGSFYGANLSVKGNNGYGVSLGFSAEPFYIDIMEFFPNN